MNDEKEQLLAKKIVNILGNQPEISHDISARLAASRAKALESRKANFYTQGNRTLVIGSDGGIEGFFWISFIVIAVMLAFTHITGQLGSTLGQGNNYHMSPDIIQYHMNAEMIDIDFLSDDKLNEPLTTKDTI